MGSIGTPAIEPEVSIDDVLVEALTVRGKSFFRSSSKFHKQGLTECHAEAATEFKKLVEDPQWGSMSFSHHVLDPLWPSAPFSVLEHMVLTDLKPPDAQLDPDGIPVSVHHGRIVHGTLCVEPFLTGGVRTVFEDTKGDAVPVVIDNAVSTTASDAEVCKMFPKGMEVAIKEPAYTQLWKDGTLGINVANPADVIPTADMTYFNEATNIMLSSREQGQATWSLVTDLGDELCARAKKHSSDGQYTRALRCYRWSLELMQTRGKKSGKGPLSDSWPEIIEHDVASMICHDRCDTYLRVGNYVKAFKDSEVLAGLGSQHLVRNPMQRAKCLHMMRRYEEEVAYLKKLQATQGDGPLGQEIADQQLRADIARRQTKDGTYELDAEDVVSLPDSPGCAPFAGSIELRTGTENGTARRGREPGMFASKDVKPGELLLVTPPLARGNDPRPTSPRIRFHSRRPPRRGKGDISSWSAQFQNTFVEAIAKAQQFPQYAAQLRSMLRGSRNRNPSLELFDDVGDIYKYPDVDSMEEHQYHLMKVNIRDIRSVMATNGLVEGGLYGLLSFFKHSCAPNCVQHTGPNVHTGGVMFIAATRRIAAGEELSLHSVSMFHSTFHRSEEFFRQGRGDFCSCPRCTFEDQALCNNIIPGLRNLHFKYNAEIEACCHPLRVLDRREVQSALFSENWLWKTVLHVDDSDKLLTICSEVADSLERILNGDDSAHLSQQHKDWIQCSFALAYVLPVLACPRNVEPKLVDEIVRFLTSLEPGSSIALTILNLCKNKMQRSDYQRILSERYENQNIYFPYKTLTDRRLLLWGYFHLPRLLSHIYVGVNH